MVVQLVGIVLVWLGALVLGLIMVHIVNITVVIIEWNRMNTVMAQQVAITQSANASIIIHPRPQDVSLCVMMAFWCWVKNVIAPPCLPAVLQIVHALLDGNLRT